MKKEYDLVVIGTGTAASVVAYECHAAGWKVAVIDSRPYGGTCALRGCDPKKVLVGATEVIERIRGMEGRGIASEAHIDWPALIRFKKTFTDPVPEDREKRFSEEGIETFHGNAQFVDGTTIKVGDDVLSVRNVLIASGSKPQALNMPGEEHVITSDQFLELDALPKSIIFLGGGYISFEFAHVASRAGAQVCILHRSERPLKHFDPDLIGQLVDSSRKSGIDIRLNTKVEGVEKKGDRFFVQTTTEKGQETVEADLVVHGAGRVPEIEDLALQAGGVESKKGILVNEYLQSISNPAVYAAGDAAETGAVPLTPVAAHEGRVVASNLLNGNQQKADYVGISSVVFTTPPLAMVGLSEKEAREQNLEFDVVLQDSSKWYSSRRIGVENSGSKVLVDKKGLVLGAHLFGHSVEEIINIFALAIRNDIPISELKQIIFAYPTASSDIKYMI